MPTTSQHLASHGVSMQQAQEFVTGHMNEPQLILQVAHEYGITNAMLGEIAGGYSASQVKSFFRANGLDSSSLDGPQLLPDNLAQLASLVAFNTGTGVLSTASLRAAVIEVTGSDAYAAAFNPDRYAGAEDGVFSPDELGLNTLGYVDATAENLESLYFGTLVRAAKSVDVFEMLQVELFLATRMDALQQGDTAAQDAFVKLMVDVFKDTTSYPVLDDATVAGFAVQAGVGMVQAVGMGESLSLFEGLLTGLF